MSDDRPTGGRQHLQRAAHELIAAARSLLDTVEGAVDRAGRDRPDRGDDRPDPPDPPVERIDVD